MENIISIIAVCVTLILGVGGFIVNSLIQRKSNSIQIITKSRLERRTETKRLCSLISKYADFTYLSVIIKSGEQDKMLTELVLAVTELRTEYSYIFEKDRELCEAAFALKDSVANYLENQSEGNKIALKDKRRQFIRVADVYIQTEWKRIKYETVGKTPKKVQSFDKTYNDYNSDYKSE